LDFLMKYISGTYRCAGSFRASRLDMEGLGSCQHVYIAQICQNPGISQEGLAKRICVNKSTVTRQLGALEQNGFVLRHPDPGDRRILRVYPTEKAKLAYPRVMELRADWNRLLLEDFTPEERGALLHMLERIWRRAVRVTEGETAEKD